jgi:formylglycine-generating enzyme required for sulfatase activity
MPPRSRSAALRRGVLLGIGPLLAVHLLLLSCGQPEAARTSELRPSLTLDGDIRMVYTAGGTFTMGGDEMLPRHQVTVSPYYLSSTEVTRSQYRRYLAETGQDQSGFDRLPAGIHYQLHDDQAATFLTWDEADGYCAWLSRKAHRRVALISEAQWEFAARAGTYQGDMGFWWSDAFPGAQGNWLVDGNHLIDLPYLAASLPPGIYPATPWGIYWFDARVWTADRAGPYGSAAETDPTGPLWSPSAAHIARIMSTTVRLAIPGGDRAAGIRLASPVAEADRSPAVSETRAGTPVPVPVQHLPRLHLDLAPEVPMELIQCPAGTITVGRPQDWNQDTHEWPETPVTIAHDYFLGATTVTQAQFTALLGRNPSHYRGPGLPVESVTMSDMVAFCDALTAQERVAGRLPADQVYRLPTEAEWECAARAGSAARYVCGDDAAALPWYAWYDVPGGPRPVASKWPNAWGFYDMVGNVLQVTGELHDRLPGKPQNDPYVHLGGSYHWFTARGGAWNMGAVACQTTLRRGVQVLSRCPFIGFRVARGQPLPDWVWGRFDYHTSAGKPAERAP